MPDWRWLNNQTKFYVFFRLLLMANFKDKPFETIIVKRGQLIFSYESLSSTLGVSVQTLRTTLRDLQNTNEINIQPTRRYSILTICNYDSWQDENNEANNESTYNQHTDNIQITLSERNNECKVYNNTPYNPPTGDERDVSIKLAEMEKAFAELSEENKRLSEENELLKKRKSKKEAQEKFDVRADLSYVNEYSEIWCEWLDYKDKIGKQYKTQSGASKEYKSFLKTANGSKAKAQAIVDQSVKNSWQGLFDIKDWVEPKDTTDIWKPNLEKYEPADLEFSERFNAYRIPNKFPICDHDWPYTPENRPDGARVCNGSDVWVWNAELKIWREDR